MSKKAVLNMSGVFTERCAPNCDIVYVGRTVVGSVVRDPSNAPAEWHAYIIEDDDDPSLVAVQNTIEDAVRLVLSYSGRA